MTRFATSVAGVCLCLCILLAQPRTASGGDPQVREAVEAYAAALTACDRPALAVCTAPPLLGRLDPRLSSCTGPGQLGSFRRAQHETALEPNLVLATLVWTRPDGVETGMFVTVKHDGARWLVTGCDVP
ncbi:MAG: hypothetical protein KF878_12735 [Planctomycetes bacterium]|nr:hypothetical protein [Planctomycetota bacterium]